MQWLYTLNVYSADTRQSLVFGDTTNSDHAPQILETYQVWVGPRPSTNPLDPTWLLYTPWAIKKGATFIFYDNFGKCRPISIMLSLLDS